jgi:hypothetical protein
VRRSRTILNEEFREGLRRLRRQSPGR